MLFIQIHRCEFEQIQKGFIEKLETQLKALEARRPHLVKEFIATLVTWTQDQLSALYKRCTAACLNLTTPPSNRFTHPDYDFFSKLLTALDGRLDRSPTACPMPLSAKRPDGYVAFRLLAASEDLVTLDLTRTLFNALANSTPPPLEFALVGTAEEVYPLISLPESFLQKFEALLLTYFPHVALEPQDWENFPTWANDRECYRLCAPYGFFKPLTDFNPDPYAAFCTVAGALSTGEAAVVRFTFQPAALELEQSLRTIFDKDDEVKPPPELKRKLQQQQWITDIEIFTSTPQPKPPASCRPARERASALRIEVKRQVLNQFEVRGDDELKLERWTEDIQHQYFKKYYYREPDYLSKPWNSATGFQAELNRHPVTALLNEPFPRPINLLSTDELAGFVHLPHKSITSPLLQRQNMQSQRVPDMLTKNDGLLMGMNHYLRQQRPVYLPHSMRNRHVYVVGASGSGKSTLLLNLIKQDLEAGAGLAVIDPHGDLVNDILPFVPSARVKDTILFNATDRAFPLALNPLTAESEIEQEQVRDEFMTLFQRLFVSGDAPRMLHILRFTVTALIQSGGKTFFDIGRLLTNPDFRRSVVAHVTDPYAQNFWDHEFPNFPRGAFDPITNKLSQFALSTLLRNILGQPQSRIHFSELMQRRGILLANLSQGQLGEENSHLLGSMLVSQIQLAAMRRASLPQNQRVPFTVYIDEFQNFMSSAFEKILSESRKYNLCLTLAHQYTSQLDESVRSAIFGNVGSMVFFKVGLQDANYLRPKLGSFTPEHIERLPRGQTIVSISDAGSTFSMQTFPPPERPAQDYTTQIIEHTRRHYGPAVAEQEPPTAENTDSKVAPKIWWDDDSKPKRFFDPLDDTHPMPRPSPQTSAPPSPRSDEPQPRKKAAKAPKANIFDELLKND